MHVVKKFFLPVLTWRGRDNRLSYWMAQLRVLAYAILVSPFLNSNSQLINVAITTGFVIMLWLACMSSIRRLHDRGMSGWWWLLLKLIPLGNFFVCGIWRGDKEVNKYGEPNPFPKV